MRRRPAEDLTTQKVVLTKPDGRSMILYSWAPITGGIQAPGQASAARPQGGHLRFHPLRDEWVIYATHRQHRTFLPPAEYNPLAASDDAKNPTELPYGNYDVAVFENLFPSLGPSDETPDEIVPTRPANGVCEVVVYTQNPKTSLGELSLKQIELVLRVWADRTRELSQRRDVLYVFPFENRGKEVGATLDHPHGQIYGYPFIPPIAAKELEAQKKHWETNRRGLLAEYIEREIKDGRRILYHGPHAVAFIPACARYAYEVWIAPIRPAPTLDAFTDDEHKDVARALKTVLLKYDGLWKKPFPYIMVWHQAPADGQDHPEAHAHIEFYPPYRMDGRLKYLAGSEIGAGVFTADTLPEEKARELQNVKVDLEDDARAHHRA
jgi:UDPglucose--hexose-1-phosphate uridylyltransferase